MSKPLRHLQICPSQRIFVAILAAMLFGGLENAYGANTDPAELPYNPPVHLDDSSMPDPARTPGDFIQKAKSKDLCDPDNDDRQRVPTAAMCERVFIDYDIPPERRFQYSCRFLVPLTIGGANTQQNVWPQPTSEAVFKEKLDTELQKRVCSEEVSPAQAQVEVAGDWVRTYRHYLMPSDPPPFVAEPEPTSVARTPTPAASQNIVPASTVSGGTPASIDPSGSSMAPQIGPNEGQRRDRMPVKTGQTSSAAGLSQSAAGLSQSAAGQSQSAVGQGLNAQGPAAMTGSRSANARGGQRRGTALAQRPVMPVSARPASARPVTTRPFTTRPISSRPLSTRPRSIRR